MSSDAPCATAFRPEVRDVPDAALKDLRRFTLEASAANTGLFHELGKALRALRNAGVAVVVLKGAHLAGNVYESIALRPMSDVDLMVKREDLGRAQEVLLAAGYPPQREPLLFDMHWGLSMARTELNIDLDGVWERAEAVEIEGAATVLGLSPEDLLLHVCIHFSLQHLFASAGLRNLLDIREVIGRRGERLSWDTVLSRANAWNVRGGVHLSLLLARNLVGAGIPAKVIDDLEPSGFDSRTRDWAMEQIFRDADGSDEVELSPYFWQIWKKGPLREKARSFRSLVFPPREFIAQKYPVPAGSKRTPLWYVVRFGDHARDYARAVWRILIRDEATLARAARINRNISMRRRLGRLGSGTET
jgi:hypothetical protein